MMSDPSSLRIADADRVKPPGEVREQFAERECARARRERWGLPR
jgi:hypothetical protein